MNTFLTKIAMLIMFLLAVTCAWAAVTMVFPVTLFNILLGILAAFFLLRAFELADKVNKLGPYADPNDVKDVPPMQGRMGRYDRGPRFGQGTEGDGDDGPDDEEVPDEE